MKLLDRIYELKKQMDELDTFFYEQEKQTIIIRNKLFNINESMTELAENIIKDQSK